MIPCFHSFWTGPPMPDHLREYVASWTRVNPGWEHRMWGDDDLGWLANQELYDFAEAITRHTGQFRADVARYEILHRHGGVWVDCDFEALAPIDDLLLGVDCFAAWETDNVWIGNAILGADPGHPMLKALIDGLPANVRRHRGKRPNILSGPQYFTPIAKAHGITLYPSAQFYPYSYGDVGTERSVGPFPAAVACHHWENTRSGARFARG